MTHLHLCYQINLYHCACLMHSLSWEMLAFITLLIPFHLCWGQVSRESWVSAGATALQHWHVEMKPCCWKLRSYLKQRYQDCAGSRLAWSSRFFLGNRAFWFPCHPGTRSAFWMSSRLLHTPRTLLHPALALVRRKCNPFQQQESSFCS